MNRMFGSFVAATLALGLFLVTSAGHTTAGGVMFSKLRDLNITAPGGVLYVGVTLLNPDPITCGNNPSGAKIYLPSTFPNYALASQMLVQAYVSGKQGQFSLADVGTECEITRIVLF